MQKIIKSILIGIAVFPLVAGAAESFKSMVIKIITDVLNPVVLLLIAVSVVIILWGVVKYIGSGGDESKRKEGRDFIVYGIIGLFVMISIWGLVTVLITTFGISAQAPPTLPILPQSIP